MFNHRILDSSLSPISGISWGDLEYPAEQEEKLYLENLSANPIDAIIETKSGLSIYNFTSPPCILDALVLDYINLKFGYSEIIFVDNRVCIDIANFRKREISVTIDGDGYCQNVLPGVAIKFYDTRRGASARIYLSEFLAMAGVAVDVDGSPGTYKRDIILGEIPSGDKKAFWYKFILRDSMRGEKNPRIFNIVAKGTEKVNA